MQVMEHISLCIVGRLNDSKSVSSVNSNLPNNGEIKKVRLIGTRKYHTFNPSNIKQAIAFQYLFFMMRQMTLTTLMHSMLHKVTN